MCARQLNEMKPRGTALPQEYITAISMMMRREKVEVNPDKSYRLIRLARDPRSLFMTIESMNNDSMVLEAEIHIRDVELQKARILNGKLSCMLTDQAQERDLIRDKLIDIESNRTKEGATMAESNQMVAQTIVDIEKKLADVGETLGTLRPKLDEIMARVVGLENERRLLTDDKVRSRIAVIERDAADTELSKSSAQADGSGE